MHLAISALGILAKESWHPQCERAWDVAHLTAQLPACRARSVHLTQKVAAMPSMPSKGPISIQGGGAVRGATPADDAPSLRLRVVNAIDTTSGA